MLTSYDYAVVAFYFVFLLILGWVFHRATKNSSEYFRGGGQMSWWLVGASSFMASFSAWTFTGAAGLAYEQGLIVLVIFWANALGFLLNWAFCAAPFRQTRVISVMEAVRLRLGRFNEQFFTWIGVPLQILVAAIWLYGLAIFCAPVFGVDLKLTVIFCGLVVLFVATTGGAWAVAAGDFLQALMLLPITIVAAVFALQRIGGPGQLLAKLPASSFDLTASHAAGYGVIWVAAMFLEKLLTMNSLNQAGRYLPVSNGHEARKAALLSSGLFLFGSLIWFIPPLVARAEGMNLAAIFPTLNKPEEGAYVAVARYCLPSGLLGLMVTGMISATMSSMDHGLNRNAGIFVRSFYLPVLRPHASERELVLAGRLSTILFGFLVVIVALFYSTMKNVGVFKLMLSFSALVVIPGSVPLFWSLLVRRNPDWLAWSTVVVGITVSALCGFAPSLPGFLSVADALGATHLADWITANGYVVMNFSGFVSGSIWYLLLSRIFRDRTPAHRDQEVDAFFKTMATPLQPGEIEDPGAVGRQTRRIGGLAIAYGIFILLLLFIPNSLPGRIAILFCALFIGLIGAVLKFARTRS